MVYVFAGFLSSGPSAVRRRLDVSNDNCNSASISVFGSISLFSSILRPFFDKD